MKSIDKAVWNRREHFEFFSKYDEPFFGLVTEVDCTLAYQISKEKNVSFFACYLHKSLLAANQTEEFRYRVDGDRVVVYDEIHASATIGREDGTYGFSYIRFSPDFEEFMNSLNGEIMNVKNSEGLRLSKDGIRKDVIHYSTIPWNTFTGLTHARNYKTEDSCPKITFGKAFMKDKQKVMQVAIYVHHGLADGFHVAQFLEKFQKLLNE